MVIYLVFISLGLPDSFLGACWPSISTSLGVNESLQGACTITCSVFTILSTFASPYLQKKFSTFKTVSISISLTILGIVGSFLSPNLILLVISMIPLGMGAGGIDSTLNNYVANNYKASQLHFLHGCWSLGAILSPIISSFFLVNPEGWRNSLFVLAITQALILIITLCSYPLWNKNKELERTNDQENKEYNITFFQTFRIKGALMIILSFFFLTGIEYLLISWFSSTLVFAKGVNEQVAAGYATMIYVGYTISRFLSGLISKKLSDKNIIRLFSVFLVCSIIFFIFIKWEPLYQLAALLFGFSVGPIYPAIVHDTPNKFTKGLSSYVMAIQIGCAYIAMITISPLFGILGEFISFDLYPFILLGLTLLMIVTSEISNIQTKDKTKSLILEKGK